VSAARTCNHLIWNRQIDPGKVFDLSLPLEQAAEGYKAMDERRAIKALLWR
jgi:threonine dehydrogenase-like Zn-dependent dehydrogenase